MIIAKGQPPDTPVEQLALWWNTPVLGWTDAGFALGLTWGALVSALGVLALMTVAATTGRRR